MAAHRSQSMGDQRTSKAPLTPEYRAVYDDNLARMDAGGVGDMASWYCLPQGMPMMMSLYDPMEIVVTPEVTYILISHVNDLLPKDLHRRPRLAGRGRIRADLCGLLHRPLDR